MSEREKYEDIDAMNASTLVHGLKSMWAMKCALDRKVEPTPGMVFGSQYHCLILEPKEFRDSHAVMPNFAKDPDNVDGKGNASTSGNTAWAKRRKTLFFQDAEAEGTAIISEDNFNKAIQMIEGLQRNPVAMDLLTSSRKEVTLQGEIGGIRFKGRVDLWNGRQLSDIKGTQDASEYKFGYSMSDLHTPFKMSIYRELLRQNGTDPEDVNLIAVESAGTFDSCVYRIPEEAMDIAFRKVLELIEKYRRCLKTNSWPGLQNGINSPLPLFIPNRDMEDDQLNWGGGE